MDINQLPVELLIKIFRHLPTYKEVALVNRRFHGSTCNMNSCLRIDNRFFERFVHHNVLDSNCLQSILASERKITKVEIGCAQLRYFEYQAQRQFISSLASIVECFSASIKSLTYADMIVDESTFLHILTLAPNVEHLELQNLTIYTDHQPSKKRRLCNNNKDLNLKKLKSLSISGCDKEFVGMINRLPVGVLTHLQISDTNWYMVNDVLSRQLKIKDLKLKRISGDVGAMDNFDKLILESLELHGYKMNGDTVAAFLSTQTGLKSATVTASAVDGQLMAALTNNVELEFLSLDVTDTPLGFFAELRKLKKLKDLALQLYDEEGTTKLMELVRLDNSSIRGLRLNGLFSMPVDLCEALAKSAPHLTLLHVCPITFLNSAELDAIMKHFNFVEILKVNAMGKPLLGEAVHIFNANLNELAIRGDVGEDGLLHTPWLTKLSASYPNLRKLNLIVEDQTEQTNSIQIEPILSGFTKLESLSMVTNLSELIIDDLDCLQHYKNRLKFVSLHSVDGRTTIIDELFVES